MRLVIPFVILCATLSGCNLFTPDELVVHPDAPVQILEVKGEYARVAVYDAENNQMIELGWVDLKKFRAWTIHKFDWEKHIRDRADNND